MSLALDIPGGIRLELQGLLCDMNGTLTVDGRLDASVAVGLRQLAERLNLYIMTADTFGTAALTFAELPVKLIAMPAGVPGAVAKRDFLRTLGVATHAVLGNGYNDHLMLAEAAIGICVLGREGAHRLALTAADLLVPDPGAALELFLHPRRLLAGLRN
ncbi:MAG TPA: ATPase P [Proteobacteria bacterium]|nr:ATPase P [Pseudomonadota bacterium]